MYDPFIARFVSADPFVDGALNTQGWNRFGYVGNNPLTATDPSGFSAMAERPHVRPIIPDCVSTCGNWSTVWSDAYINHQTVTHIDGITGKATLMSDDYFVYGTGGLTLTWTGAGSGRQGSPGSLGGGGSRVGGGAGNREGPEAPKAPPPQSEKPIRNWLCRTGNSLASGSDFLGDVSGKLMLTGLGVTAVGALGGQPEFGLGIMAVGGTGSLVSGVMQFGAGLLQGAGGGGFGNSGYAVLSVGTGLILSRGVVGPASSGYRTVSQRAADSFSNGTATVAGGVNDLWSQFVDAAAPQQVSCPGGN